MKIRNVALSTSGNKISLFASFQVTKYVFFFFNDFSLLTILILPSTQVV